MLKEITETGPHGIFIGKILVKSKTITKPVYNPSSHESDGRNFTVYDVMVSVNDTSLTIGGSGITDLPE